jgi:arylsulfatase A-like enzyme
MSGIHRRAALKTLSLGTASLALPKLLRSDDRKNPNVLFISVDDMNNWVECMGGNAQIKTPNIDRLAQRGVLFTSTYCPAPLCNPSRTAIMTGLRPSTTDIYNNNQVWAKEVPDWDTLPRYFKNNGYHVAGGGKIYHHTPKGFNPKDQWHEHFDLIRDQGQQAEHVKRLGLDREYFSDMPEHPNGSWDWGPFEKDDYEMGDGQTVSWAMDFLGKEHEKPFFLTVGLFQPHLPFYAPAKYFDLYPKEEIELPLAPADDLDDLPAAAADVSKAGVDERYKMVVECGELRAAVQGYMASISHADTLIGGLLDALDGSKYAENTIIVFWSDHGYHFGEKEHMAKRTLWERATHIPMIIAAPGIISPGERCTRPVDLMSLYPTLIELCGLPEKVENDGISIVPLLRNPAAQWDHVALTTHNKGNHAVCTEQWRYIRYNNGDEELYDIQKDPNEWKNLAGLAEYESVKRKLARQMPGENTVHWSKRFK